MTKSIGSLIKLEVGEEKEILLCFDSLMYVSQAKDNLYRLSRWLESQNMAVLKFDFSRIIRCEGRRILNYARNKVKIRVKKYALKIDDPLADVHRELMDFFGGKVIPDPIEDDNT